MQAHFRGSMHSRDGRKGHVCPQGTQPHLSTDVGAGANSPSSGSCSAIKLFLEKRHSGGLLRDVS